MAFSLSWASFRHAGKIAAILVALVGEPVLAEEEPRLAAIEEQEFALAGTFEGPASVADPEVTSGVYVAQPVGRVSVGPESVSEGKRKYAARSTVAGSATVISFSSTPVDGAIVQASMGPAQLPLARARLTSSFGVPRPAAGGGTRWHAGVDLAAPTGAPVVAAYEGRVASADWTGGYGLMVVLEHGNGIAEPLLLHPH